uniref:FAS1 domain-containing protein n=1 Tax=Panagrolaimus sp. JU765 TaxID=591449 RepID=A0AC34PZ34_9BILA
MGPETFNYTVTQLVYHTRNTEYSKRISCVDLDNLVSYGGHHHSYFLPNHFACERIGKNAKLENHIVPEFGLVTELWSNLPWKTFETIGGYKDLTLKEFKNLKSGEPSELYVISSNYSDNLWAKVVHPNILTTDGVVHIIDNILDEPTETTFEILKNFHFTTLFTREIENLANFKEGDWSFLAPTNDAMTTGWFRVFKARKPEMIENLLKFHIFRDRVHVSLYGLTEDVESLGGEYNLTAGYEKMTLNGTKAEIVAKNILGRNGYVHVIDHFIGTPRSTIEEKVCSEHSYPLQEVICKTIKNLMKRDSSPSDFVTFFAPAEKVLQKLATRFRSQIRLEDILKKHLFYQDILAEDLVKNSTLPINGSDFVLNTQGNQTYMTNEIHNFSVNMTNIITENGVIHFVDGLFSRHEVLTAQDYLSTNKNLSIFKKFFDRCSDWTSSLENVTIFAPTNDFFNEFPKDQQEIMLKNEKWVKKMLKMFIVEGELSSQQIAGMEIIKTMDQKPMVNSNHEPVSGEYLSKFIKNHDIVTKNNVVHVIDCCLFIFQSFLDTLLSRGFESGNFLYKQYPDYFANVATVFVPTENVWKTAGEDARFYDETYGSVLLRKMVVPDVILLEEQTATVERLDGNSPLVFEEKNGTFYGTDGFLNFTVVQNTVRDGKVTANILKSDILATNGIIHIIDTFLGMPTLTIWQILEEDPDFTITLKLLNGTKIESIFKDSEEDSDRFSTVFLPTNDAWKNVLPNLTEIMANSPEMIENVFKRHISSNILDFETAGENIFRMMNDEKVHLRKINGSQNFELFVSKLEQTARILEKKGIFAINGFVHKIDQVFVSDKDVPTSMTGITNVGLPGSSAEVSTKMIPFIIFGTFLI